MKKIILSLLVALMATTGANAQETLTVFDGTATNEYIPMCGYFFDNYTKSECIIPASELTAMKGGTITAITFYAKFVDESSSTFDPANQKVFLKEVSETTLDLSSDMTDATEVFDGLLPMPTTSASGYTITFSKGYTYNGGNLLIGVYNDTKGSWNTVTWYGIGSQSSRVSAYGYNPNSLETVSLSSAQTFLPKTTFTYTMPVPAGPTTSGIDWNPSTNSGTFLMPAYDVEVSTELWYCLDEAADNSALADKVNVFLKRTLRAGGWNTFCAPFNIGNSEAEAGHHFDGTPLEGADVKVLSSSAFNGTTQTLTLNFADATSIVAGHAYLVKPTSTIDLAADGNEFTVASQVTSGTNTETDYADFVPVLVPTELTANDQTVLFIYGGNELGYPSVTGDILGFRAYFQLKGAAASEVKAFAMTFDDEVATGIGSLTPNPSPVGEGSVYTLDGRKVNGQPTRKGVYIVNGKKTIIK